MNDSIPLVSIGMPVYNAQTFIQEAIDCLLKQSFTDFELIISDNASTDETCAICERYTAQDSRVQYSRLEENLGAIRNFNRVFELSRGKYFKWASHDDICAPQFLERCVEVLERCPEVVWCHTRSRHIDERGQPISAVRDDEVSYASPRGVAGISVNNPNIASRESPIVQERFRSVLLGVGGVLDSYGLIRSSVIRQTPLYLPYYGSEKVFISELALRGHYKEIPETLFFARIHSAAAYNLTSNVEQRKFIDPRGRRWFAFTRLKLLTGYLSAIMRVDLTLKDRLQCLSIVLRYLMQINKWKRIFVKTFTGGGMIHEHESSPKH